VKAGFFVSGDLIIGDVMQQRGQLAKVAIRAFVLSYSAGQPDHPLDMPPIMPTGIIL
jgi:hypothetical protein